MRAGCECNVVIATCPQRDLESTFLRCDNVAFTTLPQPKHNVVTTLSQRDFVCWVPTGVGSTPPPCGWGKVLWRLIVRSDPCDLA